MVATRPLHLLCASAALLASCHAAAECECLWRGSFTDVQAEADLVVSASVSSRKGNSIDLELLQVMRGEDAASPVRVWLKTGDYCRPEVEKFPVDSQWVMALHKITEQVPGGFDPGTPNISYGRIGDFQLSSCGGYWLRQQGGRVTGNLVAAPRWVREPQMAPVLVDLVADFVQGRIDSGVLLAASKEDPALKELMLDTKAFLRDGE